MTAPEVLEALVGRFQVPHDVDEALGFFVEAVPRCRVQLPRTAARSRSEVGQASVLEGSVIVSLNDDIGSIYEKEYTVNIKKNLLLTTVCNVAHTKTDKIRGDGK